MLEINLQIHNLTKISLDRHVNELKTTFFERLLKENNYNARNASKVYGISPAAMRELLNRHGVFYDDSRK